jgi:AI-2 transport protein TqsA
VTPLGIAESDPPTSSFGRLALILAATAGTLAAIHFAAPVFTPLFVALVLTLVLAPLYAALQRRGLKSPVALLVLMVGVLVACGLLALFLWSALSGVDDRLREYAARWSEELEQLDAWLASAGVSGTSLASLVSPQASLGVFAALAAALVGFAGSAVVILILMVFFLAEGGAIMRRLRAALGEQHPAIARLTTYGGDVGLYFALRAAVNAVTGVGVTLVLWVLGVDFPLLWGVVTFFLSFIPYVGMFLASVPSVLLALAEFGVGRALVVIIALTVVNAAAENLLQPALMSRGLRLSPTFVFVSLMFWSWLLGGSGSFLAVPLSMGLVATLASFATSRWLAAAVTIDSTEGKEPAPDT